LVTLSRQKKEVGRLPRFRLLELDIHKRNESAMMTSRVVNEMVCGPRNTADAPNTIANSKTMMARVRIAFSFIAAVYCKLLETHCAQGVVGHFLVILQSTRCC
jgi:hypothetical protein